MDVYSLVETPPWEWPAGANDEILRVLRDQEAAEGERLVAAELAGDLNLLDDVLAEELLRILADPGETENILPREAERGAEMKTTLLERSREHLATGLLGAGREDAMDEKTREHLRSLGYIK